MDSTMIRQLGVWMGGQAASLSSRKLESKIKVMVKQYLGTIHFFRRFA